MRKLLPIFGFNSWNGYASTRWQILFLANWAVLSSGIPSAETAEWSWVCLWLRTGTSTFSSKHLKHTQWQTAEVSSIFVHFISSSDTSLSASSHSIAKLRNQTFFSPKVSQINRQPFFRHQYFWNYLTPLVSWYWEQICIQSRSLYTKSKNKKICYRAAGRLYRSNFLATQGWSDA